MKSGANFPAPRRCFLISFTNDIAVIYKSKYGSSKRYAQWLAADTSADLYSASQIGADELLEYETIIFGGGIYMNKINGVELIKGNFSKLRDKNIIVFAVGACPDTEENREDICKNNFPPEMRREIGFYLLRGAFARKELTLIDRFLMWGLKMKIKFKDKEDLTEEEKGVLEIYDNPVDWTEREAVEKIVKAAE